MFRTILYLVLQKLKSAPTKPVKSAKKMELVVAKRTRSGRLVKVSARVKKGEFSKFLILRRSDKAFQELSFKKNSTKKYCFSAKLLHVEVYFTLIVLITS